MKVGFTMNFRNVLLRPWREFWEDNLWLLTEAEAMGFDYLGIQEHFFAKDGYSPSVPVFLATLIERTKTIRIGSYLYLLPFHHAAQLAQETAVLDHMSGGRLDVTVGQGHMAQEYRAWGYSPKTRPSRFEEGLAVLRAAWTERPFSFHGRYYDIDDLTVLPEPLQQPHPPLWIGGSTEKSAYRAGRFGAHFAAVSGDRTVYDAYLRGLVDGNHDPAGAQIAGAWIVTCTHEDPEAVWQRNKAALPPSMDVLRRAQDRDGRSGPRLRLRGVGRAVPQPRADRPTGSRHRDLAQAEPRSPAHPRDARRLRRRDTRPRRGLPEPQALRRRGPPDREGLVIAMPTNAEIVKQCYASFTGGVIDVAVVSRLFHPDIEWTESAGFPYAGTYHGARAIFEELGPRLGREWADWEATPDYLVADGDRVVVIGTYTATHRASGRTFRTRFAHSWELDAGLVVRYEQIVDTVPIANARVEAR